MGFGKFLAIYYASLMVAGSGSTYFVKLSQGG